MANELMVIDQLELARIYYVRKGIDPSCLYDYARFKEADKKVRAQFDYLFNKMIDTTNAGWDDFHTYTNACYVLYNHFHPWPNRRDVVSFRILNVDNVYRIRELWRHVPQVQ